jgi:hypothetical protein
MYSLDELLTDLKVQIAFGKKNVDIGVSYFKYLYASCGDIKVDDDVNLRRVMEGARMFYCDIKVPWEVGMKIIKHFEGMGAIS